jgi:hypothetical protein
MATGYSGTPLIKKLGIKPGYKILVLNEPPEYTSLLQTDISAQYCTTGQVVDLVHLFVKSNDEFEKEMKRIEPLIWKNAAISIWVSWYKKSSMIPTDLTEDVIRNYALAHDLVDVKVCAVSDTWGGLKLVVPLAKR